MAETTRIALVGDYSPDVTAHVAIPKALEIASRVTGRPTDAVWISTTDIGNRADVLSKFGAVWCVPASPYASMVGAIRAIRYARETGLPFLGTCGGYQHAVLDVARNVLGLAEADNGEVNPEAAMPLIAPLVCALVEQSGDIDFVSGSHIATLHGLTRVTEKYHCSYGIAPRYVGLFDQSALDFVGFDSDGDPRAIEIKSHPFFIGTAYQPERSALLGRSHPLIEAFVSAAAGDISLATQRHGMTLEFFITSIVVILLPGTGVLYTIAVGLGRGFRPSIIAAFGCTLGIVPSAVASIIGLAAIFHTSALAFQIVKYAGVAYLFYMAWTMLREGGAMDLAEERERNGSMQLIRNGILLNVLNPKLSLFFLAFLPQFVPAATSNATMVLVGLALMFMLLTFIVFIGYGACAALARDYVTSRPTVLTWLRRSFAGAFGLLGIRLALTER